MTSRLRARLKKKAEATKDIEEESKSLEDEQKAEQAEMKEQASYCTS